MNTTRNTFLCVAVVSAIAIGLTSIAMADGDANSPIQARMIAAVNKYRAQHSLPPLTVDPILMRVAAARAPYYDHHALGMYSWQQCRVAGFFGPATDNLCQGALTPEEAVLDGWGGEDREKNPAGHNLQMQGLMNINGGWVNQHFNRIGVAVSGRNYIAIFGREN